ncbi:MAG: CBS domain-containing protein [Candidatus Altiarchaeota archaeon]|nr:CBS domain-containing protein [Candidatus Altiarchaeota archaeon]
MLTVRCEDVWVEPIKVGAKETTKSVLKFLESKRPVVIEKTGAVVSEHLARLAEPNTKISEVAVKVPALSPDDPVFIAAQSMLKYDVGAVPIKSGRNPKYITYHAVLGAIKSTKQYTKREARIIMRPTPVISERKISNAKNVADKNDIRAVPVVNLKGKLISMWVSGSILRKPRLVKGGTRLKLIVDKVLNGPVVVINSHREPVGLIDIHELLEMSAMYREFSTPIYYSGLDAIAGSTRDKVKEMIRDTTKKIADIAPIIHTSVYLRKRGVWSVKLKVSTRWRTFIRFKEGTDLMGVFTHILNGLLREVKSEKKKKVDTRQLSKM